MKTAKFHQTMSLLRFNLGALIKFEVVYKLFSTAFFVPFALFLFKLSLTLTGHNYLTTDNILSYLTHPITLLVLCILILLLTFFSIIDISAVIYIIDASHEKRKIGFLSAAAFACRNSVRVFQPKNFPFSLFVLFAAPVASLGVISSMIGSLRIPDFILSYIQNDKILSILTAALFVALMIFTLSRLYCFHYYTLEGCSFHEATKASQRLHRGKLIQDIFYLVLLEALCLIVFYAIVAVIALLVVLCIKWLSSLTVIYSIAMGVILSATSLLLVAYFCLSLPVTFTCISVLFYHHKERTGEEICHLQENKPSRSVSARRKVVVSLLAVCCVGIFSFFSYLVLNNRLEFNIEDVSFPAVTGHRGASLEYPENTMLSFEQAVAQNADWIELDVQLTKDGVPIVMHDSNLRRTTGVDRDIWDVTYDELKDLDAGSFLSPQFSDQRIPTLNEVLDFAKSRHINLNIELKPTGHETDFVPLVVNEILDHNFQNNCVVTSQKYGILQDIKEYDPAIQTIYVMSIAVGDIPRLQYADGFSIESSFITKELVSNAHNAGKEVYAWTVNSEDTMKKMIQLNVDNLITDNIPLAKQTVYESKTSNVLLEYVSFLSGIFAS